MMQPSSTKFLKDIMKKVVVPCALGADCTVKGVSGLGKTGLLKYLIREGRGYVEDEQDVAKLENCVYSWIDIETLISNEQGAIAELAADILKEVKVRKIKKSVFKHIEEKISASKDLLWQDLYDLLYDVALKHKINVCVVIDNFHMLFEIEGSEINYYVDILSNLREVYPPKLSFLMLAAGEVDEQRLERLGRFALYFTKNTYWMEFRDVESVNIIMDEIEERLGKSLSKESREWILKNTGGDPPVIKAAAEKELNADKRYLVGELEIKDAYEFIGKLFLDGRYRRIIEGLSDESKQWLISRDGEPTQFIEESGLFVLSKKDDDQWVSYSPLFERFIKGEAEGVKSANGFNSADTFSKQDKSSGRIDKPLKNTRDIKPYLTGQEIIILTLLESEEGKVVEKEDIAKAVWGEDWASEYSQWALDKMISRLRKKLEKHNFKKVLKTVRGRGIVLA